MTRLTISSALLVAAILGGPAAHAQSTSLQREVFVNSEAERYLRALQVAGRVPLYPWSSRSFSPAEVDSLLPAGTGHPWAGLHDWTPAPAAGLRAGLIMPRLELIYNSAFPYGGNDGAVWAGRGLTTVLHAGAQVRYGPLSLVLAPVAFRAENREFELAPNGQTGEMVYADAADPRRIDLPQRFGAQTYARVDPGQSTLRLDLPFVALGISTANLHWGPADQQPVLLGSNAPGFLHGFLGTSQPVGIGIGRLHGRVVWGRLEQSDHTMSRGDAAVRFGTGMVAAFQPRGLESLELGFARFFHMRWSGAAPGKVFEAFLKQSFSDPDDNPSGIDAANQLASVFFRWVLPAGGLEVYGEYGREDHNWNFRDALLEPDHSGAYTAGFRKAWSLSDTRMAVARAELTNSEPSHILLVRRQFPWYRHAGVPQGHTHHGQVLGGSAVRGGRGSTVAGDLYHPNGRWSAAWTRELRRPGTADIDNPADSRDQDVLHSLGLQGVRATRRVEIMAGVAAAMNLNRNGQGDAWNLRLSTAARVRH